jgi:hypothetical protein
MTKQPWDGISLDDQITEVQRELSLRARVYHKHVAAGEMDPSVALRRQRRMQAVLATLEAVKASLAKGDGD